MMHSHLPPVSLLLPVLVLFLLLLEALLGCHSSFLWSEIRRRLWHKTKQQRKRLLQNPATEKATSSKSSNNERGTQKPARQKLRRRGEEWREKREREERERERERERGGKRWGCQKYVWSRRSYTVKFCERRRERNEVLGKERERRERERGGGGGGGKNKDESARARVKESETDGCVCVCVCVLGKGEASVERRL